MQNNEEECCTDKTKASVTKKEILLFGIAGVILLLVAVQLFQINSLKDNIRGNAVKSNSVDMNGWTENEKMMYEHHGTTPARLSGNKKQTSSMVGGC